MNFQFEKPEPLLVAAVNWPVLEYLIERFNRSELEGHIVLRRTPLLRELQLCLSAECNGQTLSLLSETFADELFTASMEREQLIRVISRFLLKAKHQHAELFAYSEPTLDTFLSDIFGEGKPSLQVRQDVPDSAERKTLDGSGG